MVKVKYLVLVLAATLAVSCTKLHDYADIVVIVDYSINNHVLVTDSLCYSNEAGNEFMISEIQWFFSRMELQNSSNEWIALNHLNADELLPSTIDKVFYIDTNIPESQTLEIAPIPVDDYKMLRFTFGLDEQDNKTGLFNNSPEADMFWPDVLGGGYHYMKLNGKFRNTNSQLAPLAIHLGIGQNENHTEFYQNYFIVELPIDFTVSANSENHIDLTMVVDNWFRNPNTIDFNEYGSGIMQNQIAQCKLNSNGTDAFRVEKHIERRNDMNMDDSDQDGMKFSSVMKKASPQPRFWNWKNVKERLGCVTSNDSKL